ncbi:hypothetical protein SAMN05421823_103559 [Catalinimonas alkaloidigena]|uniref:Lysylphosphatidylglycerol synthase TM region n=1 Tax=Catalinimonas alkaloidigena TaxID=1075417 RepID=A0A1G9ER87_9BACT|nr:lysylphosphatidylglycerol synthase transmembrane domain-containing protein [Catalinimonas alkaloidigena]SDK78561.1 hypothetical protein SAMN05421823_103559 [Catalinimonas alkaloidigena]
MERLKAFLKYALPVGAALLLLWYVYRDTSLEQLWRDLEKADYRWILLSIIPALISHLARSERWRLLLEPLGHRPRFVTAFLAVMSLYFVNLIVPRAGEVSRCGILRNTDGIPMDISLGTVVAERAFDLIMLLCTIGLAFMLEFDQLSELLTPLFSDKLNNTQSGLSGLVWGLGLAVLLGVGLAVLVWTQRKRLQASALVQKLLGFGKGLWQGVVSIRYVRRPVLFLLYTMLIWVCYFLMSYWAMLAFPATAGLGAKIALVIFVLGGLGMVAPVQGGVGAYHFMVGGGLMLYGVSEHDGAAAAALMHTSQTLFLLIFGGFCFFLTFFYKKTPSLVEKP